MMLAADLTTYYNRVRRHLDCPKDEQNRLLLGVNKQVIELQADAPNLDYDGIVEFLGEPESLANSLMDDIDPEVILSYQKRKHRLQEAPSSYRSYSFCCCFNRCLVYFLSLLYSSQVKCSNCEKRFSNLLQHSR